MRNLINIRLKTAREKSGLTQAELANKLGFKDRQTLSAIESGQRKISADELLKVMTVLDIDDIDYFTDPFRLEGEGEFSWRASDPTNNQLFNEFEKKAGRWLATYRYLGELQGEVLSPIEHRLNLTVRSTFEEARLAGEILVKEWNLGAIPAKNLEFAIKNNLNALILYVDAPDDISGAACQITGLGSILINRNEPEGRRNYNLAHECFHLLTWEQMPPEYKDFTDIDVPRSGKAKRIEQLANNFASALLMPEASLRKFWIDEIDYDIHAWLNNTANEFLVTAKALKWRIFHLGWFTQIKIENINDSLIINNGNEGIIVNNKPNLFNFEFVNRVYIGILKGHISIRRACSLLGLFLEDLSKLFNSYSLPDPVNG